MELNEIKSVYFVGAGGIGMSALARYFLAKGIVVGGYDRVATPLTKALENEGARLHYEDNPKLIGPEFLDKAGTLVVYTPAIPADHKELNFFRTNNFEMHKRHSWQDHHYCNDGPPAGAESREVQCISRRYYKEL